jgi:hypothetical protein
MAMLTKGKAAKHDESKDEHKKKKAKHEAPPQPSESADDSAQPAADDQDEAGDVAPAGDSGEGGDGDSGGEAPAGAADDSQQQGDGEQSDSSDEQPQGGAQQGGQGPTPVKNPQAPGAGDDTSGGDDTPAPGEGEGDTGGDETPGDNTAAGPGSESSLPQIPMSAGLKDEFERATQMLQQELYAAPNDAAAKGIIGGLQPSGPAKLRSAVHMALTVTTSIIRKLGPKNFPAQLVLPFVKEVVAHVMDLGQQIKQIQYSDQESVAIFGAAYEGAMRIFGVTHGNAKQVAHHLGRKVLSAHAAAHKKALAFAKPGIDAQNAEQQQGQPETAGPQSGAPVGAQSAPTSGAPPQQPPPQGGMLQQAAAASPAAQGESQ